MVVMLKSALIVAGIIASILALWVAYIFLAPEPANPAKDLSQVAVSFANDNGLEQITEYNGAATGLSNAVPFYIRIYQGTTPVDNSKALLKAALERAGYSIQEVFYTYDPNCPYGVSAPNCPESELKGLTKNNGKPYWVLKGKNAAGDKVNAEISTETYNNSANNEDHGEHPVPEGKVVITVDFISHEKIGP